MILLSNGRYSGVYCILLFQGVFVIGQHEEAAVVRDEPEQVQSRRVPHQVPREKK